MDMLGMSGWCCQRQCFVFRNVSLSPLYPQAQRILLQHLELVSSVRSSSVYHGLLAVSYTHLTLPTTPYV